MAPLGAASPMTWQMRFTKWGGAQHWQFPLVELGRDDHGAWFMVPPRTPLQRGSEPPVTRADGFVVLVPSSGAWIAAYNHLDDVEVYVDVTTVPEMDDGLVTAVDLDLDVIRRRDGSVELLDVDEFEEHRRTLRYPPAVVEAAEQTASWLVAQVTARAAPFDGTGSEWLAAASARWDVGGASGPPR